jgi:hypothetical protein
VPGAGVRRKTGHGREPRISKGPPMKSILALGCLCTCALLVACSDSNVQSIEANQVRPPAAESEQLPAPGSTVKLGSDKSGNSGTPPPAAGN